MRASMRFQGSRKFSRYSRDLSVRAQAGQTSMHRPPLHDRSSPSNDYCSTMSVHTKGETKTRAGIVTFAGAPNAGKSTLMNRIVGQKLAITSRKPQSTRDRIVGIRTTPESQMIVFDTPGLIEPKYALQESMKSTALVALADADVIGYIADATAGSPPS